MNYGPNIYTNPLSPTCNPECAPDGTACPTSITLESLPTKNVNYKDYLCQCADIISANYIKSFVENNSFYARLTYDFKKISGTNGDCTYIPIHRNIKAKPMSSEDGRGFKFYMMNQRRYFGEVIRLVNGTQIEVSDGDIFKLTDVSISITKPNSVDECCYDTIIKKCGEWSLVSNGVDSFGNPTAILDIGADAANLTVGSRVLIRTTCLSQCANLPGFDANQTAKEHVSYLQEFGNQLCFSQDELNSCGFTNTNPIMNETMHGKMLNLMQYKQMELFKFFDTQTIMAINEGMNFPRGNKSGETLGLETGLAHARQALGVRNYIALTSVSPKAIFLKIIQEVTKRQNYAGCNNVNYLVGTTQRGYDWLRMNREYLQMATGCTPTCTSGEGIVKTGQIMIDTGMGTIEFAIDPYLEMTRGEQLVYRFIPYGNLHFVTNKYRGISSDGKLLEMPTGLQIASTDILNTGKYNCPVCRSYQFGFALIAPDTLNGQAFTIRLVNAS